MMVVKSKTKVIKSKSSSSALATRPYSKNKKGRTKPVFPPHGAMKRRGAYFENKTTKSLDTHRANISQTGKRPFQSTHAGRKPFLSSVLSILSIDSIRNQRPAKIDTKKDKIETSKIANDRNNIIDTNEDTFETEEKIVDDISSIECRNRIEDKKNKKKYRSKILNEYINRDKFEVLQRQKTADISISSSIGSDFEREAINWMGFPRLVNDYGSDEKNVNELVKHISEGRKSEEQVLKKDPSTLVAGNKDDKKLYNFFVDILETTFSVYNVRTEFNDTASNTSSKVALEIEESVAKKLRFKNVQNQETLNDVTQKPLKPCYTITDSNANWNDDKQPLLYETKKRECQSRATSTKKINAISRSPQRKGREELSSYPQRRRLKSDSFDYPRKKTIPLKSQSAGISERSSLYKKNKKRDLLNMLREQLKMEDYHYNEPHTLFDALRVMVRNKKKNEKMLRFEPSKNAAELRDECMLKRRRILTSTSNFKYPKPIPTRHSEISAMRRKPMMIDESTDSEASNHSLEVYGFDYNTSNSAKNIPPKLQNYHFRHPSYYSSNSDSEDVINDAYS